MPRSSSSALILAALACAACSKPADSSGTAAPPAATPPAASVPAPGSGPGNPLIEAATFGAALGVDLKRSTKSASGLYYRDIVVGTGAEAKPGTQASVKYDGTLADGTRFDSGTYPFIVGAHAVVAGWDEGVAGMKVGGKRQLIIAPDLGYGASGRPPKIPPNSIMVFMVELVGVQ